MPSSGEDDQPAANGNRQRAQANSKHWLEYAIFVFVIATAIATGAAAYYTRQQWLTAVDTEIVSNRAIVLSNSINLITYGGCIGASGAPDQQHRCWLIAPLLENVGNSPTVGLQYTTSIGPASNLSPENMDKAIAWRKTPKSDWFRNIIGPKGSITGATVIFGAEVLQNSSVSQIAITLGLVRYRDTFGYPHLMEFCDYIRPQPADFSNYPVGQALHAQGFACRDRGGQSLHNCQDGECGADWKQRATEESP